MPMSVKVGKADLVLENSGTQKELENTLAKKIIPAIFTDLKLDVLS